MRCIISVIMTTRNRPHLVGKAIEAVLKQTFKEFEFIIVDASDNAETRCVVEKFHDRRIRYRAEKGNIAHGRNTGLKMAVGEYITYCDDDEMPYPTRLERLRNFLDRHRDAGLVYTDIHVYAPGKNFAFTMSNYFHKYKFETRCHFGVGATMHRRECIEKVGLFDERMGVADDWDMWLRISDNFKIAHIPETLHTYLIHGLNITLNKQLQEGKDCELIFKKRMEAARKEGILDDYISNCSFGIIEYLTGLPNNNNYAFKLAKKFYKISHSYQAIACMGMCALKKGRFDEARVFFKASLKKAPPFSLISDTWQRETILSIKMHDVKANYYHLENVKEAERMCQGVLKIAPRNLDAKILLARIYLASRKFKKAVRLLKGIEFQSPVYNIRGCCYFNLGDNQVAQSEIEKAIMLAPYVGFYHYNLALIYMRKKSYAAAREALKKSWGYLLKNEFC